MPKPSFIRRVIGELDNEVGGSPMNTLFNVADLNGDGRLDLFTSGRNGRMAWFENPGDMGEWTRHIVGDVTYQECGGLAYPLLGDGRLHLINGSDAGADEVAWWENPGPAGGPWRRRMIAKTGANQFHDELIGDVRNEGRDSMVFWNEGNASLFWLPLPDDPRVSPWPGLERIADGMVEGTQPEEGLALADLDGDGRLELLAGTHWFHYAEGRWERHKYAHGYITTVIGVGDLDGDGRPEVVLSEGDACIYGKPQGGKLAWFKPGRDLREPWEEHPMDDGLLDPHSVQLADLCGNGRLDVLVGEIGVHDRLEKSPPRLMVYENDGQGGFTRHILDEGVGVHHARVADFRSRGVLDIASRPLHGPDKWKVFVWYNNAGTPPPA